MRSELLDKVRRFIRRERLFAPGDRVLVAVSGGVDSMVLLDVLRALGHHLVVGHVDHGLRGAESDADRKFVVDRCGALGVTCIVRRIAVSNAHPDRSVQMVARELRLKALEEMAGATGARCIALAHHADDAVETLLMDLMRGTGLRGWASIPVRSGRFVRPLLGVDREMVLRHAREYEVPFREDSSNRDPKYLRNRVRHELLPLFGTLRPGSSRTLARSTAVLRELVALAEERLAAAGLEELRDGGSIPLERIRSFPFPGLLLSHVLRKRALHPDVIERMVEALDDDAADAGFPVEGGELRISGGALRSIVHRTAAVHRLVISEAGAASIQRPVRISWEVKGGQAPGTDPKVAWLDAEALRFPLELRPWDKGDRMRPIGLGGSKLVSDILTDAKVRRPERDHVHVLISAGEIAWLIGHRIGERFAAGPGNGPVVRVEWMG